MMLTLAVDTGIITPTPNDTGNRRRGLEIEMTSSNRRIDAIVRRESAGIFRSLRQLATEPRYIPTLRTPALADAYDALQAARGDDRRCCRAGAALEAAA